ncbi:kelch-like protein 38 [Glandiceps talaboti]
MATEDGIYGFAPDSTFYGVSLVEPDQKSSDVNIYKQSKHAANLVTALQQMKDELDLMDTVIHVKNYQFPCHRAILAAGSPYYSERFSLENISQLPEVTHIDETQLQPDMVQQVMSYIYTGNVTITQQNASQLLQECHHHELFQGREVENAVSGFLSRQILTNADSRLGDVEERFEFQEFNFASKILKNLNEQRKDNMFTDVIIKVGDEEFACHKVVLAANCGYFKAMFSSKMREAEEGMITVNGLHPAIMKALITYTYSGKLTMNTGNAQEMLASASFLQHKSAMLACSEFMKTEFHPSNCLGILQFAKDVGCDELYKEVMQFSLANFMATREYEEFPDMSSDLLSKLIEDDYLNVKREEQVYESVMQWLQYDKEERQYAWGKLMEKVRLPLIDAAYVSKFIESDPLIRRWSCVMLLVDEAKRIKLASCRGEKINDMGMKLRYSMKKEVMVTVGGFTDNQQWVRDVRCFNPEDGKWIDLAPFPGRNQRFACVAVKNDIYVIGGQADHQTAHLSETLSDVWKYDSFNNKWTKVASLNKPRHGHGAAVLDDKIYVVGGKIGWSKKFNEVERYDPELDLWTTIGRIKGHFVERPVVSAYKGKLYVIGYFFRDPDVIHCFDPHTGLWSQILGALRVYGDGIENAAILRGSIYYMVYRGFDNHVVAFNPLSNVRIHGKLMPEGKYLHSYGITTISDKVFISGGSRLDAGINIPYIECYDLETDSWMRAAIMPLPLCEHGCVTIHKYIANE